MTVRRQGFEVFSDPRDVIASRIRAVLQNGPQYSALSEDETDCSFQVAVQPRPTLLPTQMLIELKEKNGTTAVSVSIKSQWFIVGDVFGYYNRYIREFLAELKSATLPGGVPVIQTLPNSPQRSIGSLARAFLLFTGASFILVATILFAVSFYVGEILWLGAAVVVLLYVKGALALLLLIRLRSTVRSNLLLLPREWRALAAGCAVTAMMFVVSGIAGEGTLGWLGGLLYASFAAASCITANHATIFVA